MKRKVLFDAANFIYRRGGSKDIPSYNISSKKKKQRLDDTTEVRKVVTHSVDNGVECGFTNASIPGSVVFDFHAEYEKSWALSIFSKENNQNFYRMCFKEHYYEDMKSFPLNLQIDYDFVVGDSFEPLSDQEKTTYLYRQSLEFIEQIHARVKEVFQKGDLFDPDGPFPKTFYTLEDHALFVLISDPLFRDISDVTKTKTGRVRYVYYWPNIAVTKKMWTKFRNMAVTELGSKFSEREDAEKKLARNSEWNDLVSDDLERYLPGSSALELCGHGSECSVHAHGKQVAMNATDLVFVLDSDLNSHADIVAFFKSNNANKRKLLNSFCTLNADLSYKLAKCSFQEADYVQPGITVLAPDDQKRETGVFKVITTATTTTDKRNRNKKQKKKTKQLTPEAINYLTIVCGIFGIQSDDFVLDLTYQNPCIVITEQRDKYCPFSNKFYSCTCSSKFIIDFKLVPIGLHKICGCSCGNSAHYDCRGKGSFYCDPGVSIMAKLMDEVGSSHRKTMYNPRNNETNVIERHNGHGDKSIVRDLIDEINLRCSDKFVLIK